MGAPFICHQRWPRSLMCCCHCDKNSINVVVTVLTTIINIVVTVTTTKFIVVVSVTTTLIIVVVTVTTTNIRRFFSIVIAHGLLLPVLFPPWTQDFPIHIFQFLICRYHGDLTAFLSGTLTDMIP